MSHLDAREARHSKMDTVVCGYPLYIEPVFKCRTSNLNYFLLEFIEKSFENSCSPRAKPFTSLVEFIFHYSAGMIQYFVIEFWIYFIDKLLFWDYWNLDYKSKHVYMDVNCWLLL